MIPGASLSFTSFSDEFVAWATRNDLQEFFENIRIPVGTTDDYGSFKQVEATEFEVVELVNSDTFNIIVDSVSLGEVPTKNSFLELKNAFIALQASYNELLIKLAIIKAINEKTLVYTTNKDGGLNGICFGEDHKEEKRLHVKCLVGYKRIKDFIKYYKQKYPGYFISAYRYNKLVNYNF